MCKSISQGLLMSAENFGWIVGEGGAFIIDNNGVRHYTNDESRFLTSKLNVTYAVTEDNYRKSNKTLTNIVKWQSVMENCFPKCHLDG